MSRTIGKVARELAINVETIRFYERRGLIEQPEKPANGYRHYPDDTLQRIRFIRRCQGLGFTLDEILHLLNLHDKPCQQVQILADNKLALVKEKIADLQRLEKALQQVVKQCQSNQDEAHCPIIDTLQETGKP